MASLPPISSLPSLDTEERARVLDTLFEPCRQLHTLSVSLLREKTFSAYDELINAVGNQLRGLFESDLESDAKWLDSILSAHPRLGEKKVDSEQSRKEQAQLNQGDPNEAEKLAELNRKYEETFPGLRYVQPEFDNSKLAGLVAGFKLLGDTGSQNFTIKATGGGLSGEITLTICKQRRARLQK
ncbi:hypothetical protein KCU88_g3217, partial [Aureobasidium melanogenum]